MKRRLTKAYDHMTMPEGCAHRIEQQMLTRLQEKKIGHYAKTVSPVKSRRSGWAAAAAAVCAVVLLSVGGSTLFLNLSRQTLDRPEEPVTSFATAETTRPETAEDHYALVTKLPAQKVEAFAAEIRQNVLDGDWEAFAGKVHYPIAVYDKNVGNDGGLVGLTIRNAVKESFVTQIEKESCTAMFCNWQGICMADGRIWINEVDGELKITAINDMFGDLLDPADFQYAETETGKAALYGYSGMAEEVTIPSVYNQNVLNQIGTGTKVIWNGEFVRTIHIPESVTSVWEWAFADCPALEAVFFQGDAPEEMEGVFHGSDNVVVYYQEGTKGWGDTWCGRPTQPYSSAYVSLGTVTLESSEQMNANQAFGEILKETDGFYCHEFEADLTISRYCEKRGKETGTTVTIPSFTLVDMDRDGVKELILRVCIDGDPREDYLILRYQDNNPGIVYCFMEPDQRITDLRKDGSFYWRGEGPEYRESRLILDGNGAKVLSSLNQTDAAKVLWHTLPCQQPETVVQSYEYVTGTGQSLLPGSHYYYFEGLVLGSMGNDWDLQKDQLLRYGLICMEDEGTVEVFDPDAPGTALYGTLSNENGRVQLAELGYYISTEEKEFVAEVRGLLNEEPEYVVDAHLPALGSMGRRVYSPEELVSYFGFTQYSQEAISERHAAKAVVEKFAMAWLAGEEKAMKPYLADDFREDTRKNGTKYSPVGTPELMTIRDLPNRGEECYVTAEFWETEQDSYFRVCLDMVKQKDGWKVKSCYFGS